MCGAGCNVYTDFGLCSEGLRSVGGSDSEARPGVGTAQWMAPELMEGRPPTLRADVFSYAVVLWELLLGARAGGRAAAHPGERGAGAGELGRADGRVLGGDAGGAPGLQGGHWHAAQAAARRRGLERARRPRPRDRARAGGCARARGQLMRAAARLLRACAGQLTVVCCVQCTKFNSDKFRKKIAGLLADPARPPRARCRVPVLAARERRGLIAKLFY
jgi:hypothetical protein